MSSFIGWIRDHPWQSVSAGLGVALVAVAGLWLGGLDDGAEPFALGSSTTTTLSSEPSTTSVGSSTTSQPDGSPATTATSEPTGAGGEVVAVIVDNVPGVGYQIGLSSADLLIETPVEGGLSRFVALYGSDVPSLVGPVRSLRPVSADLLAPFSPVTYTTGGQPFVVGAVQNAGVAVVTPDDSIAFQSLERPRPHHIFVSPDQDTLSGTEVVPPWTTGSWVGGRAARSVDVPISGEVTWVFENGAYARFSGGEPQEVLPTFDGAPEPLTRDTLILLVANEKSAGYTDGNGVDVPTFDVIGGGRLYVFHGGEMIEGHWLRESRADSFVFSDEGGGALAIPGSQLYLAVVPRGVSITFE